MHDALPENLAGAWDQVREELRASLLPSIFDLWVEPLRPVSLRGATLYIAAPASVRAWAERRYLPRIEAMMRAQAPELREVRVLPAGATEPPAPGGEGDLRGGAERGVRPAQTFDRFVIGPGNRLGHASALAVAELPGEAYNPLFLHGAPGLGKTHLLGAIALYLKRHRPDLTVRYTTAERFTAEFVTALRSKGAEAFKDRYRELNVLLIDDVQFLEDKPHTEEEFFHTFNALYEAGGQLVLSCDRPPEALSRLAERLRDRFEWGLRVELSPPDLRTRITLLQHLAGAAPDDSPPPETLREIAARVPTNFRRLEGALVRVTALASLSGHEPTPELVREVFEQLPNPDAPLGPRDPHRCPAPTIADVQEAVCAVLHLSRDDLLSTQRTARVSSARQLAMYLSRELTGLSLARIAEAFRRDHSTVVYAIRRVESTLEPGSDTHQALNKCRGLLGGANASEPASTGTATAANTQTSSVNPL